MGACLSCLGLRSKDDAERTRLLYDDPYNQGGQGYGTWGNSTISPQNIMNPEEVRREQEALDSITRWASDQIVEIFPHQNRTLPATTSHVNGHVTSEQASSPHQDMLLSMIPGDKSKRSIRIYPASRPTSKDAQSLRSRNSISRLDGSNKNRDSGIFVRLDVDLP